jgi:hypothetical protein
LKAELLRRARDHGVDFRLSLLHLTDALTKRLVQSFSFLVIEVVATSAPWRSCVLIDEAQARSEGPGRGEADQDVVAGESTCRA